MSNFFLKVLGGDPKGAQKNLLFFLVLGSILAASIARIQLYGNPQLSIAGNDTQSYIDSSRAPLFSSAILTGRRLLTTNLFYKAFEPEEGYRILVNGSIETTRRAVQPTFNGIIFTQLIFSIIGWGLLALTVFLHLQNPLMKFFGAAFVLLFAYTPQMADWDSILMSESLTFSLFALQLALLIQMVFSLNRDPKTGILQWLIPWGIIFFLWTFLRDTNIVVSVIMLGMIVAALTTPRFRGNRSLLGTVIFLTLIIVMGLVTAGNSVRSIVQIRNLYNDDIFPYETRVSILQEMGMPAPGSSEFEPWLQTSGSKTIVRFMLEHPGYVVEKLMNDFPLAFQEIKQTYFKAPDLGESRVVLMQIGDGLHPENTTPFLLNLVLLAGLLTLAFQRTDTRPWVWISLWLFLAATLTLIPSILGDTWAINRHALFSTMIYRLSIWLFPILLMDIALANGKTAGAE